MLFAYRLLRFRGFIALSIYLVLQIAFISSHPELGLLPEQYFQRISILNLLMTTPLMLIFFTVFSSLVSFNRRLYAMTTSFLALEFGLVVIFGLNEAVEKIIEGASILLLLSLATYFFISKTKLAITRNKGLGKAFLAAGILFVYVTLAFVYILNFFPNISNDRDSSLIFIMVMLVNSLLLLAGIRLEWQKLKVLKELQITRKELAVIYKEKPASIKKAASAKAAPVWKEDPA